MKVTAKDTKIQFTPIELKISIESYEELRLLRTLFCANIAIPNTLLKEKYIYKIEDKENLSVFMRQIHISLTSK